MKAAILIIGTELLTPFRRDTNSLFLTEILNEKGVGVNLKIIAGDSEEEISRLLLFLAENHRYILLSGGLGPTEDDVTRDAVARFLGVPLRYDPETRKEIETYYLSQNREIPDCVDRQCFLPEGCVGIPNASGTAPGFFTEREDFSLWAFPGVPGELEEMVRSHLVPRLTSLRLPPLHRARLVLSGKTESECESMLRPYYRTFGRESMTLLSGGGKIEFICASDTPDHLQEQTRLIRSLFPDDIYTTRAESIEDVVTRLLAERNQTLAVAESCTGGLLSGRMTNVPGVSAVFRGGVVVYSDESKISVLRISEKLLNRHGAVSRPAAEEMARSVRSLFSTDYAIGITGIAGPGGGTEEKPVGTVHMAISDQHGVEHRVFRFPGGRDRVRSYAVQLSLDLLRRRVTK